MKIVSWNVNGLRALHRNGYWGVFLRDVSADVLCLQETKTEAEQLPSEVREAPGFNSSFSSSKLRKGYSGVGLYISKKLPEPDEVLFGMGEPKFDDEGRIIGARWGDFLLLNIYFPNGGQGQHRIDYKLDFYDAFLEFINDQKSQGRSVVFCGDVNTAHEPIDLARPKENAKNTGFLPEERAWVDELVTQGWMDIWRQKNPEKVQYTYWDAFTHARERNAGWRIDYFFGNRALMPKVKKVEILGEIYGSDHCPVLLDIQI